MAAAGRSATVAATITAISVLTREFLDDIGAENTTDMFKFAMSSNRERTDPAGGLQQAFDVWPSIRGFTESSITRDYMPHMIQSRGILATDRFKVERTDLSRGLNSILYGASRPGGAVNTSSKRAVLNGAQKSVSFAMRRLDRKRSEVDLAFRQIKDKLALRANTLLDDREGWFEFEQLKHSAARNDSGSGAQRCGPGRAFLARRLAALSERRADLPPAAPSVSE